MSEEKQPEPTKMPEVNEKSKIEEIQKNAEEAKANQVPAPLPQEFKFEFLMSEMFAITLKSGTRVSFAADTSYDVGMRELEAFKVALQGRQKQADKISNTKRLPMPQPIPPKPIPPKPIPPEGK